MIVAYGSWPSPLSAELLAAGGVGVGGASSRTNSDGSPEIWWGEARSTEGGRSVIVRRLADGTTVDAFGAPWSARTAVHEYGGGAWFHGPDHVYFSNWDDQRLYRVAADAAGTDGAGGTAAEPEPVSPEPEEPRAWRYADGRVSPDGSWIVAVGEDHHDAVVAEHGEAVNSLVALPAAGGEPTLLTSKTDFVAAPRFSPDGRWLSWVSWDHPDMPWDATTLCAAPVWQSDKELRLGNVKVVAGGLGGTTAVHGANWTADGRLVYSDDRTGWWNLYQWMPGDEVDTALTNLEGTEIGTPAWVFGLQQWTETADGRLFAVVTREAVDSLAEVLDGGLRPVELDAAGFSSVSSVGDQLLIVATHRQSLPTIFTIDPPTIAESSSGVSGPGTSLVRHADQLGFDGSWFSSAQAIAYPSNGRTAHAFFYPPTGVDQVAEVGELPPLVVIGHGGPTSHTQPSLNLKIQYWTTRGFAVVDVNYGGSSGFGRAYRQLLNGAWGIVDVEDCVNAARHLAEHGLVDPLRLAIRGGSAGGFTVLTALIQTDVFSAGTSLYGVADLEALATDTHKFESRYLDGMIGPYPEDKAVYEARSPINHTDGFSCPLLVLQGTEDAVVPPNQAEAIVAAVASKGIPHASIMFEGEQHGFRRAENIVRSLEAELWFYGRVFGFSPADTIEPVADAVDL